MTEIAEGAMKRVAKAIGNILLPKSARPSFGHGWRWFLTLWTTAVALLVSRFVGLLDRSIVNVGLLILLAVVMYLYFARYRPGG